jgi:hypothetical protein
LKGVIHYRYVDTNLDLVKKKIDHEEVIHIFLQNWTQEISCMKQGSSPNTIMFTETVTNPTEHSASWETEEFLNKLFYGTDRDHYRVHKIYILFTVLQNPTVFISQF